VHQKRKFNNGSKVYSLKFIDYINNTPNMRYSTKKFKDLSKKEFTKAAEKYE
jgi:hypothetical protein